jgi:cytoskeletal protein CcmA (bactofilin family)
MAMSPNFFNKRETEPAMQRHVAAAPTQGTVYGTPSAPATQPVASPVAVVANKVSAAAPTGGSKLIVGPNIKLKGVEITDCDTLVVEGMVEATMDSRVMEIAEQGAFKGSAEIDVAEIYGQFDGNLTVRQKLVIYATGKVTGKIRYGKLVIEEGGQLSGDIQFGAAHSPRADKPALAVAGR